MSDNLYDAWDNGDRYEIRKQVAEREKNKAAIDKIKEENKSMRLFLSRLLDPEDLGYAVTPEVRLKTYRILNENKGD